MGKIQEPIECYHQFAECVLRVWHRRRDIHGKVFFLQQLNLNEFLRAGFCIRLLWNTMCRFASKSMKRSIKKEPLRRMLRERLRSIELLVPVVVLDMFF